MRPPSIAFATFRHAQKVLNDFFWSSELSFNLVRQRLLSEPGMRALSCVDAFGDVRASALIAPNNRSRRAHFDKTVGAFEGLLVANLNDTSCHVIIRFHAELDRFLDQRLSPLRRWSDNARKRWRALPYQDLAEFLCEQRLIARADAIDRCDALQAQVYRVMRHKLAHVDDSADALALDPATLRHRVTSDPRARAAIEELKVVRGLTLFEETAAAARRSQSNPEFMFHALFALRSIAGLAAALDKALPPAQATRRIGHLGR